MSHRLIQSMLTCGDSHVMNRFIQTAFIEVEAPQIRSRYRGTRAGARTPAQPIQKLAHLHLATGIVGVQSSFLQLFFSLFPSFTLSLAAAATFIPLLSAEHQVRLQHGIDFFALACSQLAR